MTRWRSSRLRVLLFSTGIVRQAPEILKDQDDKTKQRSAEMIANLHAHQADRLREQGRPGGGQARRLRPAAARALGAEAARARSCISNPRIDHWYEVARSNGAVGGKLIGAGGGGFLMFLADDPTQLAPGHGGEGLAELRFKFRFRRDEDLDLMVARDIARCETASVGWTASMTCRA